MSEDLDLSWLQEHKKMVEMDKNYCREPMESVACYFFYINANSYIDKIVRETVDLSCDDGNIRTIFSDVVLGLIQSKKRIGPVKYRLLDILVHNVDLLPEHIQEYVGNGNNRGHDNNHGHGNNNSSQGFLKVLPIVGEVSFDPSIFIFHGINAVYFMFQEIDTSDMVDHGVVVAPPVSILKTAKNRPTNNRPTNNHDGSDRGSTKKVRISTGAVVDADRRDKRLKRRRFTRRHVVVAAKP